MNSIVIRTIIPILLLIGTGLLSRKLGILRSGDERVLSAYVYYFALPALFLVNMAETNFTGETFRFIFAGIIPVFVIKEPDIGRTCFGIKKSGCTIMRQ